MNRQTTSETLPQKRLNVLVVAENASPSQGGESYLAIQWFRELLKQGVDVHLLVHARSRPELEQALATATGRLHYVPELIIQKIFWHLGRFLPSHIRDFTSGWIVHLITQAMQRRAARRLIAQYDIAIVHEPTPVAPRLPSLIYDLGVPVVIGPMNGNMTYPPGYRSSRALIWQTFVPVARAFSNLANFLVPGKRHADVLVVANERSRKALPAGCTGRVEMLCENGVDPKVWHRPDDLPAHPDDRLRLVFLGRLVAWKGVDLVLDVFAEVKKQLPIAELHIIGDGPARRGLQAHAATLGLGKAVTFHGWVAPEDCPRLLAQSDVFVFPSVYDCGGAVVLEAMSLGLAVVAINWGGPSEYLADGAGVLVEPGSRRETVAQMAQAVLSLTPHKRREIGDIAQRRIADHYTWPAKIRQMLAVYRSACKSPEPALSPEEV